MKQEHWLMEMLPLAEEIRHGKGTPEKADRLAELVLLLNDHLFKGGDLPQAWFVPLATDFAPRHSVKPPPLDSLDDPFRDSEASGVHSVDDFDLSCFDEPPPPSSEPVSDDDIEAVVDSAFKILVA